jgi:hypothetical protein
MNLQKLVVVICATLLSSLSAQASCYWVKVDDRYMECRTPLNRMVLSEESRSQILQTILLNSQNYLNRVFNNSEVMDIVTGGQPLDNRLVERARNELAQSNQTVELLNQLTEIAELVQAPDETSPTVMPAALVFGVTISTPRGVPVPGPVASIFRSSGSLTVGGASVLLAVVAVPYAVEFVAEKVDVAEGFTRQNPHIVYQDRAAGINVYRTGLPFYQRFGVENSLRIFPNLDLRISEGGPAARAYKTSKSLINVGAAWGSTIMRPDDLGAYGLSYTQPTSSATVTPVFSSLYANTLMSRLQPLANFSLAALNRLGVDSLKISMNSRTEFWARDFHAFDQMIALLRWPTSRERGADDLSPSGRFGVNVGLDLMSSLNVFGNVILSVERSSQDVPVTQEDQTQLNLDQRRMQLRLRQAGINEEPLPAQGEFLPPPLPL